MARVACIVLLLGSVISFASSGIIQDGENPDLASNPDANPDSNLEDTNINLGASGGDYQDGGNNTNTQGGNDANVEGGKGKNPAQPAGKPPIPGASPVDPKSKERPKTGYLKFKAKKINLVFEKAKKRLDPGALVELYGDLVVQDQLELDAKKASMDGKDEDGEQQALVRQKLMEIIKKYQLYTDDQDRKTNTVDENDTLDKKMPSLQGGKVMDSKLSKIWKKAQEVGFSDQELDELKQEMSHHQQKLDEFNQLKNELDSNSIDNNLTEEKGRLSVEEHKKKKADLKEKWREIKDGFASLESMKGLGKPDNSSFSDPKVARLWKSALAANFSEIELDSFKEELRHFEHRLQKHDYYKKEHAMHMEKLKLDPNAPESSEHLDKLQEKMDDQSKKLKKIHHELKSRVTKKLEL